MVEEELVQLKSDCMMDRIWVHFNTCLLLPLLCSRKESLLSGPKVNASAFSIKNKKIAPKGANDIKLINTGKILENNKMVSQCRVPFGDLPKAVIAMHVVVQPSVTKVKT
ncbi:hypothetical protein Golob_020570, partial [Gossypium lobatum]|nr:hypothetical protein [Gossypium lobatum]